MRALPAHRHRGKPTPTPQAKGDAKFLVIAKRQDGRRRVIQAYSSRQEADLVVARLGAVGCPAVVEVE
jgi:hypothetical protein